MSINPESLRLPLIYTATVVLAAVLGGVLAAGVKVGALVLVAALPKGAEEGWQPTSLWHPNAECEYSTTT